ncbi:phosphotyrosine-specific ptp2-like protein [Basidiobolus ranarum]|uniref:Phosphotyrosine-specific ptp2-like protein n=1 Tax=Basidiobolus ranarum TaxID=34480 RepID=A0ABR2VSB0_9FUNG
MQESKRAGPMIVHCSAGCGRTGAFCTIDTVLESLSRNQIHTMKEDLIAETVDQFRDQRLSMVQTLRQFVFCYEAVLWRLMGAPGCERLNSSNSHNPIQQEALKIGLNLSIPLSVVSPKSGADYFAISPSQNTTLTFSDPRRTSYFG